MSIIESSLSTGDRLQQVKENHPSKTIDGVNSANPEICDEAEWLGYDFGNIVLGSIAKAQESPRFPVLAD
jgi:hypothetical protein